LRGNRKAADRRGRGKRIDDGLGARRGGGFGVSGDKVVPGDKGFVRFKLKWLRGFGLGLGNRFVW
jgi:hypothetical protein